MENLAQKEELVNNKLPIPVEPIQGQQLDLEFEFKFVTPRSPNTTADYLFLNEKIFPHEFFCSPTKLLSFSTLFRD